jgi:phosphoribosylanthranilate isomerase
MEGVDAPKIKFCGINNLTDAEAAVAAGAWALGLNLWKGSKRRCKPGVAAEIAAVHRRHVQVAGVFVNATLDQVTSSAEQIGLTMLQFHGDEGPAFCAEAARRTGCRVIKAARVHSGADIQALAPFKTDFHLLDAHVAGQVGGTGETFAWELARSHRSRIPVILAGGLTPENVGDAIAVVHPYAVDVASGIEDPAHSPFKDHALMRAFADAVAATAPEVVPEPDPSDIDAVSDVDGGSDVDAGSEIDAVSEVDPVLEVDPVSEADAA